MDLCAGFAPPVKVEAIGIPGLGESPLLLERDHCAARLLPLLAPTIYVVFRPEEQHGLSGKDNIVPPISWGECKMNDAWSLKE